MALSQDEQRMLAEIERRLAADDPGLASCLTTFRRPGPAAVLRSPRARIIGSLFTVLLVAMISLMVYAMIPFRTHLDRHSPQTTTSALPASTLSSVRSQADGTGTTSTTSQSSANRSTAAAATGQARQTSAKPTSLPPETPSP